MESSRNQTSTDQSSVTTVFMLWNQTNQSLNGEPKEEYVPYEHRLETYLVPAVFVLVFLIGSIGNGTLIYIFLRNKSMRNVPNTFIFSLAAGDLIVITGTVPFISTIYTVESWPYGESICKLSEFLRDVSVGVTVLTLMVLSIDRYLAIAMPMHKHKGNQSRNMTFVVAGSIWVASIGIAVPGAYYSFLLKFPVQDNKVVSICYPFPPDLLPWYARTMVLVKFLLLYTIPLVVIASFYVLMARHLLLSSRNNLGKNDSHVKYIKVRTKVARLVLVLIVIFAICFFPNHVFMLWFYFHPNSINVYDRFWHVWKILSYILTFVNSCLNPIALCCISGVFRNYFKRYLFCCCFPKRRIERNKVVFPTTYNTSLRSTSRVTASTKV